MHFMLLLFIDGRVIALFFGSLHNNYKRYIQPEVEVDPILKKKHAISDSINIPKLHNFHRSSNFALIVT